MSTLSSNVHVSSFLSNLLDNPVHIVLNDKAVSGSIRGVLQGLDDRFCLIRVGNVETFHVPGPHQSNTIQHILVVSFNVLCLSLGSIHSIQSLYDVCDIRLITDDGNTIVLRNGEDCTTINATYRA